MDCPHLEGNIDLKKAKDINNKSCKVCEAPECAWICLKCGFNGCGRLINGHAMKHFEETGHPLTTDSINGTHHCYLCDDFVVNENKELQWLTQLITHAQMKSNDFSPQLSIDTSSSRSLTLKDVGLRNLGNTCYMNSVLQALFHTPQLQQFFSNNRQDSQYSISPSSPHSPASATTTSQSYNFSNFMPSLLRCGRGMSNEEGTHLLEEFSQLVKEMSHNSASANVLTPSNFFTAVGRAFPSFRGYRQQDAQEFLRCVLDRMDLELNKQRKVKGEKNEDSEIYKVFGGTLLNEITCLQCNNVSTKEDPFLDLSLDIPDLERNSSEDSTMTITDCLASFTSTETLAESEKFRCESCKSLERCTKKFSIKKLPEILCLHLKRFRWTTISRLKVNTFVAFPVEELQMAPFVVKGVDQEDTIYDLYAGIVHIGSGLGYGHYIAFAKNFEDEWMEYNDSFVRKIQKEEIENYSVYMLFYKRRQDFQTPMSNNGETPSIKDRLRSSTRQK